MILLLLSFPSVFGSLGKRVVPCYVFFTICELFIQTGFCGGEVFFGFWCLFVGFVVSQGGFFLFNFCYSEVQIALGSFQVASVAGSFCSCLLTV